MQVIYEDNHIIAVNKTGNEIVQGDKTGDTPLSNIVKAHIKQKYNKPGAVFLGVTHRLDRPTSGVVLFARTSKALSRLNKLFQQKNAIKKKHTGQLLIKNQNQLRANFNIGLFEIQNKTSRMPIPKKNQKVKKHFYSIN